jgi:CRISPR system Cascade subunit CasD
VTVLLLRLAGPLQSWGDKSRFNRRETRPEPTKSGVLGLLAAAQGRRRVDPVEDLARTRFGVRVDQPGTLVRDFHTAHALDGTSMPLSVRYYLTDAVFLAAVQGDVDLLAGLDAAVRAPMFPLYLGRRSCPPSGVVALGLREGDLESTLRQEPWQASRWHQERCPDPVAVEVVRDADPAEAGEVVRDQPVSYDPERRQYGWRTVRRAQPVELANPAARSAVVRTHDPFDLLRVP